MIPRITVAEVKRNLNKDLKPGVYKIAELVSDARNFPKKEKP